MALLEIAIDSVEDGRLALDSGADRLEVCSRLDVGGCTPLLDDLVALRSYSDHPLFVMIRPRPGSFVHTSDEKQEMLNSINAFVSAGADGFVFGALTREGLIDEPFTQELMRASEQRPCTFHRAFDELSDPFPALDVLADLKIARILTSGGAATSEEGRSRIRELRERAGRRLVIVPGGGVRPSNIERILHDTHATEIHSSGRDESGSISREMVALLAGIAHAMI